MPRLNRPRSKRVGVGRVRHGLRDAGHRLDVAPVGHAPADVQQALDDDVLGAERPVVAAFAVAREAAGGGRRRVVHAGGALEIAGGHQRHAAHQRQARVRRQHRDGQGAVDRAQRLEALLQPQPHPAGAFGDAAEQVGVVRLGGVAQRLDRPPARRERLGDAAVEGPVAVGVLLEPTLLAVVPDERVQAHRRPAAAAGRQQPGERARRRDPPARVPHAGHLVDQVGVEAVEQREVEYEAAVRRRDAAPQPRLDPPGHRVVARRVDVRHAAAPGVAVDAQRNRPARRVGGHGGQLAARQLLVEEPRDVRLREPQVVDGHRRAVPFKREHRDLEPRRRLPERHRHVQVGRRAAQQRVEHGDRLGVRQLLDLVERQHARRAMPGERPEEQFDPVLGLAVGLRIRLPGHAHGARPGARPERRESGLLKGERQVRRHRSGAVPPVEREPGDDDALLAQRAAAVREQGRLAEPAGGVQHRQPTAEERAAILHLRPLEEAVDGVGRPHLVAQQPGRVPDLRRIPPHLRRTRRPAAAFVRHRSGPPRPARRRSGRGPGRAARRTRRRITGPARLSMPTKRPFPITANPYANTLLPARCQSRARSATVKTLSRTVLVR